LHLALAVHALAGGSGLNTVVVVNVESTNSLELGNYFCERRQVPPENVLRIDWPSPPTSWTSGQFQTNLLLPLLAMLADRQLTNQIDYVVLSMDIPFQTVFGSTYDSTTAVLFYGLKPDPVTGAQSVLSSYAQSESIFDQAKPATATGYSFLATMLTAGSLAQAKQLVDQGLASDSTFPHQLIVLAKTSDPLRNIRWPRFDNAIFNARVLGNCLLTRTNSDSPWGQTNVLGYETGLADFSVMPHAFVPGAMADSLTSYGGLIIGSSGQTSLLAFINAGAAGSYGTVSEPLADPSKFPDPIAYFYQARGFSLAECYYQSIYCPFLGLVVAEPLAAPYSQTGTGGWLGVASNSVLRGTAKLSAQFSAADLNHLLQQLDLFVDGKYLQTLTNLVPRSGNVLTAAVNGYPVSYIVPTNATLASVAAGLASALNAPSVTNITKALAVPSGDRIELRSVSTNTLADPFYFTDTTANPGGAVYYRVVYLPDPIQPQLALLGKDPAGAFRIHAETPSGTAPYLLQASTNLADWLTLATFPGGPLDFSDADAPNFPQRFYRVAGSVPDNRLSLSLSANPIFNGFKLHVQTSTARPYVLQASTNLATWTSVSTNLLGGPTDFVDVQAANFHQRFYRAAPFPQPPGPAAQLSVAPGGAVRIQVNGAVRPYVIQASTNLTRWTTLITNLAPGKVRIAAASSAGVSGVNSTFVNPAGSAFLDSVACGLRPCSVDGSVRPGSWLQFNFTKTNGATVSLAVTNQSSSGTIPALAQQLVTLINSSPGLAGPDGLDAEDLAADSWGGVNFNLRARSGGYAAALAQVSLAGSADLNLAPAGPVSLTQNLPDLQPRTHLFLATGSSKLALSFPLDTTALPDGFHELSLVAYEGSHVRTQTRATVPVRIQNRPLAATLTLLDLPATAPVTGTYHLQITANTNNVSLLRLFSTGGVLNAATNQPGATFTLSGSALGAGLHPFYALIQAANGQQYRTETHWVRFTY